MEIMILQYSRCAYCNSCKCTSNVMKFTYIIHISYSMVSIESGLYRINGWSTETNNFSDILRSIEWKFSKRILAYLYFTKYNKINMYHLIVLNNVSYTGSYKRFLCIIVYTSKGWKYSYNCVSWLVSFILNLLILHDLCTF